MRLRNAFAAITVVWLTTSCATSPEKHLTSTPLEIEKGELSNYWVARDKAFSFKLGKNQYPPMEQEGYVKVRFLIDSNGNTFEPTIIESVPEGMWDEAGLKAAVQQEYAKAEQNPEALPVFVTTKIEFSSKQNN